MHERGPPCHKPFSLVIITEDGEEKWCLTFSKGPQFWTWKEYREHVDKTVEHALSSNDLGRLYGEHQLFFFERESIWGYYCPKIRAADVRLLLDEWARIWGEAGWKIAGWRRI